MSGVKRKKMKSSKSSKLAIAVLILFLFCLFLPFYIMIVMSFKDQTQALQNFWLPTFPLKLDNYVSAWESISMYYVNSFKISILTVAGIILVSVFAGYSFAKYKYRFKEQLYFGVIAFTMIPTGLILIPMYLNILQFGLNNNSFGVILPRIATGAVMATMLTRGHFETIPDSIFESARIEGAGELTILGRIVLPLSKPVIGTIAVMDFFGTFNEYMWPYIVLSDDKLKTVPIGLAKLAGAYGTDFGYQMAGYTLAAIPLVIIFLFTMKIYVGGITAGAIKA